MSEEDVGTVVKDEQYFTDHLDEWNDLSDADRDNFL